MNLHTDLIKNKSFTHPICSELQKHSQEYRVLATLRYLIYQRYDMMTADESPDLQDKKNSVGIEVTVAVNENDMRASRTLSELSQENNTEKIGKSIKRIESCGYSPAPISGDKIAIVASGTSDEDKLIFQRSIRRKMPKYVEYRSKLRTLGLAIVLPEIPTTEAENCCVDWICEEIQKDQNLIDFVYVLSHRFCIYYDVRTALSKKWMVSSSDNRSLCIIARMTAESELTLDDQEWQPSTTNI